MEKSETIVKAMHMLLIFSELILVIIVWRRRHLAYLILYIEIALVVSMSFMPYAQGN